MKKKTNEQGFESFSVKQVEVEGFLSFFYGFLVDLSQFYGIAIIFYKFHGPKQYLRAINGVRSNSDVLLSLEKELLKPSYIDLNTF